MGKEATALYAEADGAAERPEITSFDDECFEVSITIQMSTETSPIYSRPDTMDRSNAYSAAAGK